MKESVKKSGLFVLGLVVLFAAYEVSRRISSHVHAQEGTHNPYTLSQIYYDMDPKTHQMWGLVTDMHAVRSDGSYVSGNWVMEPNGHHDFHRMVLDLQSRVRFWADPTTETLNVINASKHDMMLHGTTGVPPDGVCRAMDGGQVLSSTQEKYFGYDVTHITELVRHGTLKANIYYAPRFDCYPLKRVYYFTKPGSSDIQRIATHETTLLVEGEPDPSLFERPVGYVDRTPTEVYNEVKRRFGGLGAAGVPPQSLTHEEEMYRAQKQIPPSQ
jgi:hypothetical protein